MMTTQNPIALNVYPESIVIVMVKLSVVESVGRTVA
jgi:hypothetical protein